MTKFKEILYLEGEDAMNIFECIKMFQFKAAVENMIDIASNFDHFDIWDTQKDGNPYFEENNFPWGSKDYTQKVNFDGKIYTLAWNLGLEYCSLSEHIAEE